MNSKALFSSKSMVWETPKDYFDKLNRKFKFDLDACASDTNHKVDNYFTEDDDALEQKWGGQCVYEPTLRTTYRRVYQKSVRRTFARSR